MWRYRSVWAVAALAVAAELVAGLHGGNHFCDDAYYYFVTARNFWQHGFFTFDGLHATSGFHPLWMWLITACYGAIGAFSLPTQVCLLLLLEAPAYLAPIACCVGLSGKAAISPKNGHLPPCLPLGYIPIPKRSFFWAWKPPFPPSRWCG